MEGDEGQGFSLNRLHQQQEKKPVSMQVADTALWDINW